MDKTWFELKEYRTRRFSDAVWVPIHVSETLQALGKFGELGYLREFFGLGSLAVPLALRDESSHLAWSDIGIIHNQRVWAEKEFYKPVDTYWKNKNQSLGVEIALLQEFDGAEPRQWHLNQDFIFAFGLLREGDEWVRPAEGYIKVARLRRNSLGEPVALEIRNEFLREYLTARASFLRISWYRSRETIVKDPSVVGSPSPIHEQTAGARFELRVDPILQGGWPGGKVAVFQVARTDVDSSEDVPTPGPETNENTKSKNWQFERTGTEYFRIEGELWRDDVIEPAQFSSRIRGEEVPTGITYIVDALGTKLTSEKLDDEDNARWLWFKPSVIADLKRQRGTEFKWYTKETGGVGCGPGGLTHFGINNLGLITVYAYDVAKLYPWQQRIWSGHNVVPEGGVSKELLAAQMETKVAETRAPENSFSELIVAMDDLFVAATGKAIFRSHHDIEGLIASINRFRTLENGGLFALAKDVFRAVVERMDKSEINRIAPSPENENWGALKSLEKYLGTIVSAESARNIMGPLHGTYKLRHADAHLPSLDISEAYTLIGVNPNSLPIDQGFTLIDNVARSIWQICDVIHQHMESKSDS